MKKQNLKTIVTLSLLIAADVVLERFLSVNTQSLKIGVAFLAVAFAAREYGVLGGAAVGGLGDLVGALLFPIGPYFPGFSLTAALTGVCFAIGFKFKTAGTVAAVIINNFVLSLFLNTLWIHLLYGSPFWGLLPLRLIQSAIISAAAIPLLLLMERYVPKISER